MKTKNHHAIYVTLMIFLMIPAIAGAGDEPDSSYLFSYFKGNGEDGLHLAYSRDGLTWEALNYDQPFVAPEIGNEQLMRDPCIIQGRDGFFHMVWTVSWNDRIIGHAFSKDLLTWSHQRVIPVMMHEPEARNCWAPELFYDDKTKEYIIFWSTTITGRFPETAMSSESKYNHRIYCTTTRDFTSFTPTRLFLDPGFNCIDGTINKTESRYVMFFKDERLDPPQKNIRMTFSDSPRGPWVPASAPITGDYWAEGPTALKTDSDWIVYFDNYRKGTFGAVRSSDLKTWEDISDRVRFPDGARHGTVFTVSTAVLESLEGHTRTVGLDMMLKSLPVVIEERVYKKVGDTDLRLYIFSPEQRSAGEPLSAIVFFFGGGWTGGTPEQFFPHSRYLASRGMVAISAEYRVKSRHGTSPAECLKDGKSAIRWVKEHAGELGIDPHRIAAGGGSAGGQMAAGTALIDGFEDEGEDTRISSRPDALVLFNPALDTTVERWSERFGVNSRALSPNHHVRKDAPPTIVFHGTSDTTVPFGHAETFARLMKEAGNDCRLVPFEGMSHGFFNYGRSGNIPFIETVRAMDSFLVSQGYLHGEPGI